MIKCVLTLCPGGMEGEHEEHLGTIYIDNLITTTIGTQGKRGDYRYRLKKKRDRILITGKIKMFPRLSYHPWNLVRLVLNHAAETNGGTI